MTKQHITDTATYSTSETAATLLILLLAFQKLISPLSLKFYTWKTGKTLLIFFVKCIKMYQLTLLFKSWVLLQNIKNKKLQEAICTTQTSDNISVELGK